MYCPTCGSEVIEGLRYCNRCGGNLIAETVAPARIFMLLVTLAIAVLLVGSVGLAAIFFFAIEFLGRNNVGAEIILFLIVFTLSLFGIEALLIRQLSRLTGVYLQNGGAHKPNETRGISQPKTQNQLTEARQNFLKVALPHTTDADETESATRLLPDETELATRRLENER